MPTSSTDEIINIPDDIPFVPKPIERIQPEFQLSTAVTEPVQKMQKNLPTFPKRKPSISSGQTKGKMFDRSIKKPTLALCNPTGERVRYPTDPVISTSKQSDKTPLRFPTFYIDRQGNTKLYTASKRPANQTLISQTSTRQIPTGKTPSSQATGIKMTPSQTHARTYVGPNPTSQTSSRQIVTNETTGSKTRAIKAPSIKTQTSQVPTKQPLRSMTQTKQTVARTSTGQTLTSHIPNNQTSGSKTGTIQASAAKTQTIQVPRAQPLGSKTPTNQKLIRTSTGPTPTSQTFIITSAGSTPTSQTLVRKSTGPNPTYIRSPVGLTITNQTSISKTPANQRPGSKTRIMLPAAKTQTSQAPTNRTVESKTPTDRTVTRISTGPIPTSQTPSNQTSGRKMQVSRAQTSQTLVSKTPTSQTLTKTSSGPTPTSSKAQSSQPQTNLNTTYKTPSSHTLTRTSNSRASSSQTSASKIQITQTPTNQASVIHQPKVLNFDTKLIYLQKKCGIVISKVELPQPDSTQPINIVTPLQNMLKRPQPTIKRLQKNVSSPISSTGISKSDDFPPAAIKPPSTNTSTSSKIIVDQNASLKRKSDRPNILKREYKDLHLKRKQEFTKRLEKLPTRQIVPIPASPQNLKPMPHIEIPTEPVIITIDEDDLPEVEVPTKTMDSVLSTEVISSVLPMNSVPRTESWNSPKPKSRVEPFQLISVVDLLAESATIVIDDDDDDPMVEILPEDHLANKEVVAQSVAAEVVKESSTIITLSEKPTYTEEWLDNNTTEVISIDPPTPIQEERIVANSSDSIRVAVSAIRLDVANKIADALDKLLDPICESAEDTSSGGKSKRKVIYCKNPDFI